MATAQNIIDTAGSYIRIVSAPGAPVDATTSADMLKHLQGMLGLWSEKGLVEIPPPATLGTDIDESPGAIEAIAQNLAVQYGTPVGKPPDLVLVSEAKANKSWLGNRKTINREISMAKDGMHGTARGRYNIQTDS
jgi:hypothetical protein